MHEIVNSFTMLFLTLMMVFCLTSAFMYSRSSEPVWLLRVKFSGLISIYLALFQAIFSSNYSGITLFAIIGGLVFLIVRSAKR